MMTYASAGDDPAIFIISDKPSISLAPTGPIIASLRSLKSSFANAGVPGTGTSTLILGTDGLTEARSPRRVDHRQHHDEDRGES